jgi:hypothetical protein
MKFSWIKIPVLCGIFCLTLAFTAYSQVNTEKYRKYYNPDKRFLFNAITTFSIKAGNTEYTAFKGTGRIDYNGKKFDNFLVGNFEYKNTSENTIENQGFLHWRGIWQFKPRTSWEFFLQRQYDEFTDLNARNLVGTAIKYRLIEFESSRDSTNTLDINISTGFMYETEEYEVENQKINKFLWRNTTFLSIDWLITEKLNLTGVIYYQPAFADFNDFRVAADAGFEFAIAKSLFFIFNLTYRYNSVPVKDVKPYDVSIDNGIRLKFN